MTDTTNLQDLKALLKWANLSDDIQELQIKYGDIELAMSRTPGGLDRPAPAPAPAAAPAAAPSASPAEQAPVQQAPAQAEPAPAPAAQEPAAQEEPKASGAPAAEGETVTAPMVGTYYASPKPGADPFVKVGDEVEVGQVLCIVEVMKLMNNVVADVAGTVTGVFPANAEHVEFGTPLVAIRPDA